MICIFCLCVHTLHSSLYRSVYMSQGTFRWSQYCMCFSLGLEISKKFIESQRYPFWILKTGYFPNITMLLLLLSRFSRVRLRAAPQTAARQAPRPWDSPGKNPGVGCHFLLQCMKVKRESEVAQSCLTPSDPIDCSPPGSSVPGIFQARALEWVPVPSPAIMLATF